MGRMKVHYRDWETVRRIVTGRLLDKIGKQKALWFSNLGLIAVFSFLALSFFNFWVIALCLGVWGVFQGVAQTSAATLMTLSAGESRGFAMACMSSTTYLAVASGSGYRDWETDRKSTRLNSSH